MTANKAPQRIRWRSGEPARQADHRRLLQRLEAIEDAIAYFYDAINDLHDRIKAMESGRIDHERL